jgi:uncharacterized protein YndB with AHSA1/START domain
MKTEVTRLLKAPPDKVWAILADGGDVHRWFDSAITTCVLTGTGEGATRLCTMTDGAMLQERIIEVDHARRRFRYAIERHPLPASSVTSMIVVAGQPDGRSAVTWTAEYAAAPEHEALIETTLAGLYSAGLDSLDLYLSNMTRKD